MHTTTKASLPALVLLSVAAPFAAAQPIGLSDFSNFTPLAASVPTVALPPETPFQFGNAGWTQLSIADRATQLARGQFNTGAWDMIDVNRTGPDGGATSSRCSKLRSRAFSALTESPARR